MDEKMKVDDIREKAQSIIKECDKWKDHPEAVLKHGYAREKAQRIVDIIDMYNG